jgi:hypothetical protein
MMKVARKQLRYEGIEGFEYLESTAKEKIGVLDGLLTEDFEIYEKEENGNIYVYDILSDEIIHDNGKAELNLHIFMDGLIENSCK